jgi:hypothetical protein
LSDELARHVQKRIESFYCLEPGPDVGKFVHQGAEGERESLLLRESRDDLELLLVVPKLSEPPSLDERMQLVEGVSHFVYIAERARIGLPATELELELQAEVDKFVFLAFDEVTHSPHRAESLCHSLFRRVRYLHAPGTESGERYRLANDLAARVFRRLFVRRARAEARRWLIRFYRSGQTEKIRLARAA